MSASLNFHGPKRFFLRRYDQNGPHPWQTINAETDKSEFEIAIFVHGDAEQLEDIIRQLNAALGLHNPGDPMVIETEKALL